MDLCLGVCAELGRYGSVRGARQREERVVCEILMRKKEAFAWRARAKAVHNLGAKFSRLVRLLLLQKS